MVPSGIEPAPYSLKDFIAFVNGEHDRLGRIARNAGMKAE